VKPRTVFLLALLIAFPLISGPAWAHHSMSMYDRDKQVTFKAIITQFEFANPHAHITFTVAGENGNIQTWTAEGPGPNRLADRGWTKDTLKPGDQVTIVGNPNKDGSTTMRFVKVTLPNGQELEARPRGQ
jgi:hypothetical protein